MDWYRFGDGLLGLRSEDSALQDRFRTVFSECRLRGDVPATLPRVVCTVASAGSSLVAIAFEDPSPLDAATFAVDVFQDRGYRVSEEAGGWRIVTSPASAAGVAFHGSDVVAPAESEWRPLVGNLAVNRVLRLQSEVLFLHAASVAVGGCGALLTAPKMGGKTTLSTALAARGHGFLGDEMAAVRLSDRRLLPYRRALSIREGPRSSAVHDALEAEASPTIEHYPDGEPRRRALARELFPDAPAEPAELSAIFALRSFSERPRVERFEPAPGDAARLAPFASTLWETPPALRALRIAQLMSTTPCYLVDVGDPDATADLIEDTLEA